MELLNQLEQLAVSYPKTAAALLVIVGALAMHLWGRFRRRIAVLNWSALHQRHASGAEHPQYGRIRVLVNETEARALYFTQVTVHNPTVKDFENLDIEFELPIGTTVVASEGRVDQDIRSLAFTDAFTADADAARAVWNDDTPVANALREKVTRWRAYTVPALNRLSTANFSFLWENAPNATQLVNVGCSRVGLKMVFKRAPAAPIFGVDQNRAAAVGLILSLLVVVFLAAGGWAVYASFVLGACVKLVGIGAIKGWETLIRVLS